jgi:hypothetical protein
MAVTGIYAFRRFSMRPVIHALVGVVVVSLVAAAGVRAETPTAAHFAACNSDAQAATRAGTATPTTKDFMRVEAARRESVTISVEASNPQLVGMAPEGIMDAAYQATYRTCMRRNGF